MNMFELNSPNTDIAQTFTDLLNIGPHSTLKQICAMLIKNLNASGILAKICLGEFKSSAGKYYILIAETDDQLSAERLGALRASNGNYLTTLYCINQKTIQILGICGPNSCSRLIIDADALQFPNT